jgi:hypothetical protein
MTRDQFTDTVLAMMESEHGTEAGVFDDLATRIAEAYDTEGQIPERDLVALCSGDTSGEVPPELLRRYPLLADIFDAPFLEDEHEPSSARLAHFSWLTADGLTVTRRGEEE